MQCFWSLAIIALVAFSTSAPSSHAVEPGRVQRRPCVGITGPGRVRCIQQKKNIPPRARENCKGIFDADRGVCVVRPPRRGGGGGGGGY